MKIFLKTTFLFFLCLQFTGCAKPVTHNTESGKIEVTIAASPKQIIPQLIGKMIDRGYTVNQTSDYLVSFDKPSTNSLANAMLGSRYDGTPNFRVIYTLIPLDKSTRVVGDLAIITNPHSAFEQRTDMNGSQDSLAIEGLLENIQYKVEKPQNKTHAAAPKREDLPFVNQLTSEKDKD